MDLKDFKLKNLGIDKAQFGRIFSFIDFGNVNYWYEKDRRNWDDKDLSENQKLIVDIEKLASFLNSFSNKERFYYGLDNKNQKSIHLVAKARKFFITNTKPIQWVRHYLSEVELNKNSRPIAKDLSGIYVKMPKCNFDVEICIDAIRLLGEYDTFC